jgi:hypothetical protein
MADNRGDYLALLKKLQEQDNRISQHINKKIEFRDKKFC